MPFERYFIDRQLRTEEHQELKGAEFHHLAHVMRIQKGDPLELINGKGTLAKAVVEGLTKEKALLKIERVYQEEPKTSYPLILAQAISKSNRLEFILEKGTELGVDSFWLFPGQYSVKKEIQLNQIERLRTITISAIKQCGRLYLPSIVLQPSINQWENLPKTSIFFGDLNPSASIFEIAWRKSVLSSDPIIFVTGPEGGLSQEEVQSLKDLGAIGVKLHPNTLRTETASLMAISLLSHWLLIYAKI